MIWYNANKNKIPYILTSLHIIKYINSTIMLTVAGLHEKYINLMIQ